MNVSLHSWGILRRIGPALLVIAFAGAVGVGAWARAIRSIELPTVHEVQRRKTTPRRPSASVRLDLGTPSARSAVLTGFGPDETVDGRTALRQLGGRASVVLNLAPDPAGARVFAVAQAPGGTSDLVALHVNGSPLEPSTVPASWGLLRADVPAALLVAGHNQLDFVSERSTGGLALDILVVEGLSARADVQLGTLAARATTAGFRSGELDEGRDSAILANANARIDFKLRPLPQDYGVTVTAKARDSRQEQPGFSLFVNGTGAGSVKPAAGWSPHFVAVKRGDLVSGDNRLDLAVPSGTSYAFDRVAVLPLEPNLLIDIGAPEARVHLGLGFSTDESVEGRSAVWSDGPTSKLHFGMRPLPVPYRLALCVSAFEPLAPVVARLVLNGQELGSLPVTAQFGTHAVPIEAGRLNYGHNMLEVVYPKTATPRQSGAGSADDRHLALRFDWLEIAQDSGR